MVSHTAPSLPDTRLLGRLVAAMAMGARAADDPIARLRFACGKLQEIQTELFPSELQDTWQRILEELIRYGPGFETMPRDRASRLVAQVAFAMGALERLAGL